MKNILRKSEDEFDVLMNDVFINISEIISNEVCECFWQYLNGNKTMKHLSSDFIKGKSVFTMAVDIEQLKLSAKNHKKR